MNSRRDYARDYATMLAEDGFPRNDGLRLATAKAMFSGPTEINECVVLSAASVRRSAFFSHSSQKPKTQGQDGDYEGKGQ